MTQSPYLIDCLQYANWSPKVFDQMAQGGVHAVHVTIAYNETFRETVYNVEAWNRLFEAHPDRLIRGSTAADIDLAKATGRRRSFLVFKTPNRLKKIWVWLRFGISWASALCS